ncbi:hypothetical protein L202_07598 [Cryptococcus amylolentus CBS 6039]|uniref:Protein kinase domain-containing protein n=1 Tax=Cryptococcus amylolentus CBS 6039 TaxID=1295533 RepID=A0A1E3HCS9_9TREE|nr:hypothetical protein L202_07598 [Cryptococcus amylolentus CBS 6039]ODN74147.1 hypothetical protein L202_07598 [Cryptococcus amylolentus CBS 6039]
MAQPALRKSKSNLRQRLGLTSTRATHLSPIASAGSTNLASSTSTTASSASRTDSRSAFTYDTSSPSPPLKRPEFDTISYNSAMSASIGGFTEEAGASNSTLVSEESVVEQTYQTPAQDLQPYQAPSQYPPPGGDDTLHPNIASVTSGADDIFSLTDQQLSDRFTFISEIGFGNWGSVWLCKPKHARSSQLEQGAVVRLGKQAAASGGSGAGGKVAIKLVHRSKTATTAARVRALWGEMKIIRSLRHEPHPSVIQFEAFVITPSYALVIMPHLSHLIPVCLPPYRATPYFRQLASAVGYLHERGITHNDIKPANVLLSHNDIPVLVDFGFAQKWDIAARGSFLSSISWGTPEYLDPQRARGMPHDERASDVWSLGITMFEILIGRTPFEADDQEQFSTPEELVVYYERTKVGRWVGEWDMPPDIEVLLHKMINPDPAYRITAMDAYHDEALQPSAPSVIVTPHFVRQAANFEEEPLPAPPAEVVAKVKRDDEKKEKRKSKKKVKPTQASKEAHSRSVTPALGESIKQHTSISKPRREVSGGKENERVHVEVEKKQSKLVIKKLRDEEYKDDKNVEEDPTPTKMSKPAQALKVKEHTVFTDKKVVPRTSNSQLTNLSRPNSAASGAKELSRATSSQTLKDKRASGQSFVSGNKEDAVLRTMRSLEGTRKLFTSQQKEKAQEALASIKRPAPSPPRPKSLDSAVEKEKKIDERRSLGIDRALLPGVKKEDVDVKVKEGGIEVDVHIHHQEKEKKVAQKEPPMSPPRAQISNASRMPTPSPQKSRRQNIRPHAELDATTGKIFPASDDESPLSELRDKIIVSDQEKLVRFRQASGGLTDAVETLRSTSPSPRPSAEPSSSRELTPTERHSAEVKPALSHRSSRETVRSMPILSRTKSIEALTMDSRLDKMSSWIKNVEAIIEDARRAVAEGREPGLPVLSLSSEITGEQEHRSGVTPDKPNAIPAHLRTSSVQVEPSTPPQWMTYTEAEEKVKAANAWMEEQGRKKKERPSVNHVLKLFGGEKEKAPGSRSGTPEPGHFVPLKPPAHALRGVPSTPALRGAATIRQPSKVPHRKSESNLRNFNTMPVIPSPASFRAGPQYDPDADDDDLGTEYVSDRRMKYETMLSSDSNVSKQGDGWTGTLPRREVKPSSSMASLRERARTLLGDSSRHHVTYSDATYPTQKVEKRSSRLTLRGEKRIPARPNTPAAASVMGVKTGTSSGAPAGDKKKGWVKSLKGAMGMKK